MVKMELQYIILAFEPSQSLSQIDTPAAQRREHVGGVRHKKGLIYDMNRY